MAQKIAVVKLTASKNRNGIEDGAKSILQSNDNYCLAQNPFFKFIYEEVKKLRGEQENEKTKI